MIPRTGAAPSPKCLGTSLPPRKVVAALRFHQRCCKDAVRPGAASPIALGSGWPFAGRMLRSRSWRAAVSRRSKAASFEKSCHPVELIGQVEQFLSDLRNVGLTR
jgi:hypothetical protein